MVFKKIVATPKHSTLGDVALLLIRLVAGSAFMMHGWSKIQHPFSWMGPHGFAPGFLQALAALSEFGGGLAWILGLVTPIASLGILCTMAVALWMHLVMRGDAFVSTTGGPSAEPAAGYFCVALLLLALGPGRFSIDRIVFGKR